MTVLTGADGQLKYGVTVLGKVRDFTVAVSRDALESTCLGDFDRTYVEGLRGATGSATLLYDPSNEEANAFLDKIFLTSGETGYSAPDTVTFRMNRFNYPLAGGTFVCNGFLTSVSPSVSVGSVQAVSINFQVSGKPAGVFDQP